MANRNQKQWLRIEKWFDPFIFLFLWSLLLRIQNPGLMADDSGEMVAAAAGLGIPHPPGYPLATLMGHIVSWMPLGTPAFRSNLLSSFFVLMALRIGFRLLEDLGQGVSSTSNRIYDRVLLVLMFFSFHSLVGQALTAKGAVYSSTLLLGCFLFRVISSDLGPFRHVFLPTFLWAVGMAHHWQTTVLWTPLVLLGWIDHKDLWGSRSIVTGIVFSVLGLSTYLFLPLRAIRDCVPSWGYPIHPSLFYWVLSRQLVSQVEHWVQPPDFYWATARELWHFFSWGIFPLLAPLGLLGAWDLFHERRKKFWLFFFWGVPVIVGILMIHEAQNIYLLPVYLVSLGMWLALLSWNGLRILKGIRKGILGSSLAGVLLLSFLIWDIQVFVTEDRSRYFLAEDLGVNILRDAPRGAILLTEGDPYVMPIWYERVANGKRPDLIFEPSVFLVHGWGWKQIADQSEEVGARMARTSLFQDRLVSLTTWGGRHPLCYSLGHEKLGEALQRLPGAWLQHGLVREWSPDHQAGLPETFRGDYRIRVSEPWPTDPASSEIFAYYQLAMPRLGL